MTPPRKKTTPKKVVAKARVELGLPPLGQPVHPGSQEEFDLAHRIEVAFPLVEVTPLSWDLPPFTTKKVRCPKCGIGGDADGPSVGVFYHPHVTPESPCWYVYMAQDMGMAAKRATVPFPEHLDRRCPTCQHQWTEALATAPWED